MWKVVFEFVVVEIHDIARFLLEEVDALLLWHLFQVVPVAYSGFKIGANLGVLGEIGILRVFFAARLLNGRLALLLLRCRFRLLGDFFPSQITLGCEETASVSLRRELFPTREYETFRLPAGVYRTLRVSIGQAGGHNWWCVVFPALCLPAAEEDFTEACRAAGLTDQEISVLTEDTGEVELEFRTLEWLGKLKKMLWDA